MLRSDVLNRISALFDRPTYLEIGVQHGITFDAVQAARKVAVDVKFLFDVEQASAASAGQDITYHECPSDEYFERLIGAERFDLVFLDGLHSFEQTLRDLMNAIGHLREGGVILVDDVFPHSYAASLPDQAMSNAFRERRGIKAIDWMGDVYKLVFFIRDYLPGFSFATLMENHGQTVLWKQPRALDASPRSIAEISHLSFAEFHLNVDALNIKPFEEVMDQLRERPRS
jgi:SAM-dependent methyltransferase